MLLPMPTLTVYPSRLSGRLQAPPSKNYTTRYLLAAALAQGESAIERPADSEDAGALKRCLTAWGTHLREDGDTLHVRGFGNSPRPGQRLDVGNAGAVARFLLAAGLLAGETEFVTPHPESLGVRPQGELLAALRELGADVQAGKHGDEETLPVRLRAGAVQGGEVGVGAGRSSQFASALLFVAPLLPRGLTLTLGGDIKSAGPLRQTLHTLAVFGVEAEATPDLRRIAVPGGQRYQARALRVPGDYPGGAALLVAGAVAGGEVRVEGLLADDLQGEREAVNVLREMGADIARSGDTLTVRGGQELRGVSRDGDPFTDAVQALCAAAARARGQTEWRNIATLRLKECDRIAAVRGELSKLGVRVEEGSDWLRIVGGSITGGTVHSHGDHRMVMLLAACGLVARGPVRILEAQHVAKSYPGFVDDLRALGARLEWEG